MRSLQWHLKSHWSSERDSPPPPHLPVPWSRQVEEDLSWWMVRDHLLEGMRFGTPTPDLRLYSDASWSRWGAHLLDRSVSGDMVEPGELAAHQSAGDESPVSSPAIVPGRSRRPLGDSDVRQFDGSRLCQQAEGHHLRLPLLVDSVTSPMDRVPQCPSGSDVPARTIQCPSRTPQPPESSTGRRVVSPPTGGEETNSHLGIPVAGLVRDTSQCEATPVMLFNPGPPGSLRGCLPSPLERPRHVLVPFLSPGRESRGSGQRDPKSLTEASTP